MKYYFISVTAFLCITLSSIGIYAEIPHKTWKEPFSEESHKDVEGWITDLMVRFYHAYHENALEEMQKIKEQIQNLTDLEFKSNRDQNDPNS